MINCKKGMDQSKNVVYQFMADNVSDVNKCVSIAKQINKKYCEEGYIRVLPVSQVMNNIPVFTAVVDTETLPTNYNPDSDFYTTVSFSESSNFVDLNKLEWHLS